MLYVSYCTIFPFYIGCRGVGGNSHSNRPLTCVRIFSDSGATGLNVAVKPHSLEKMLLRLSIRYYIERVYYRVRVYSTQIYRLKAGVKAFFVEVSGELDYSRSLSS
jgi:hypothetical protein